LRAVAIALSGAADERADALENRFHVSRLLSM
jgi:hypothetical protein